MNRRSKGGMGDTDTTGRREGNLGRSGGDDSFGQDTYGQQGTTGRSGMGMGMGGGGDDTLGSTGGDSFGSSGLSRGGANDPIGSSGGRRGDDDILGGSGGGMGGGRRGVDDTLGSSGGGGGAFGSSNTRETRSTTGQQRTGGGLGAVSGMDSGRRDDDSYGDSYAGSGQAGKKGDSTIGKFVEKAGGMLGSANLEQKGHEKRQDKGYKEF